MYVISFSSPRLMDDEETAFFSPATSAGVSKAGLTSWWVSAIST